MKKTFYIITVFITAILVTPVYNYGQTTETINIPNDMGSLTADILYANNKIFAYAPDGINVFDATNNAFVTKIPFDNTGTFYGKFNPVYFDSRLAVRDQNLMVYNNRVSNKYVFALTPALKLLIINTDNLSTTWTKRLKIDKNAENYLDQIMDSQSGRVILKYDNNTLPTKDRLYVMVGARDPNANCIGNFHEQTNVFAIYDVDYTKLPQDPAFFTLHYVEVNTASDNIPYGQQINNYTFNDDNNYFYVVRLGIKINNPQYSESQIEIRTITPQGSNLYRTIHFENIGGDNFSKMGKLLHINSDNIHKIIVFPYRYFQGDTPHPRFCVIEGNTPDATDKYVDCPSKKVLDAVYLEQNHDLIISYEPDNNNIVGNQYQNTNIAIFHYNSTTDTFEPTDSFQTDNSLSTSDFDYNASFYLSRIDNSSALISRKDAMAKIIYSNGTYTYTDNILTGENNFFGKTAKSDNNKIYIINRLGNGLDVFNINSEQFENRIETGYPVYDIEADATGGKLLLYNKLNAYNTGLYIYNTQTETSININNDNLPDNNIATAIGDCKYNPFTNEFLISEFRPGIAKIIRINANDNTKAGEITISGHEFAKEMFISPDGYLYVCTNMNKQTEKPTVYIYDANSYALEGNLTVSDFDSYSDDFAYYSADFQYNPFDQLVYVTFTVQEKKILPYNSIASSIYDFNSTGVPIPPGKLLIINNKYAVEKEFNLSNFPSKIICPFSKNGNENSQYKGKLFIIGQKFYVYNYLSTQTDTSSYEQFFVDIAYDAVDDKLFAIKESNAPNCTEHKIFEIWTITYDVDNHIHFEKFNTDGMPVDGQIASMFYNKYDSKIYVYKKVDAEKIGTSEASLMSFDPNNPIWQTTTLGIKTYFPDYDHTRDDSHYYMLNLTTPYIDPYTNKMYLPNGGHSNVSVVEYDGTDTLTLRAGANGANGITWLSIPKHMRPNDPELTPTPTVLAQSNITGGYSQLVLKYNKINPAYHTSGIVNANWNQDWQYSDDLMRNINSTRGYKLELLPNNAKSLYLYGAVEDQNSSFNLYCNLENWIGYFLFEKQNVFDALGSIADDIYLIQHQDYTCYRYHYPVSENCNTKSATDYPPGTWICDGKPEIKYGDMIIVKPDRDITGFQWNNPQQQTTLTERPEATYYAFEKKVDYATIVIELDTSQTLPDEIGAFVNDSCVGAGSVIANDSVIVLKAYLGGQPQDSVSFEEHYASRSVENRKISAYYVLNPKDFTSAKRSIKVSEKKDVYLVSFRDNQATNTNLPDVGLTVYPNPAHKILYFGYHLQKAGNVKLEVYNMEGERVAVLVNEIKNKGTHKGIWKPNDTQGFPLTKGLYLIRLTTENQNVTKKIVMQ